MKIFISGIGGSGAFYLAKYFICLGHEVYGSDCNENARIASLNIPSRICITSNAVSFISRNGPYDMYIYSSAFDDKHPERKYFATKNVDIYEVGQLTDKLISDCLSSKMSEQEKKCAITSELLPLVAIDWNAKKYIAVTGTDGKTTTVSMIYHILKKLGKKVAVISTVGMFLSNTDELIDTGFHTTTPSAQELYKLLSSDKLNDIDFVILETTSHSLAMGRVALSQFDAVAVTNVTSEHLDYHKTWENYFLAKSRLLTEHVKKDGLAILNSNDKLSFEKLKDICQQKQIKYIVNENLSDKIILDKEFDTWYNRDNASLAILICQNILNQNVNMDVLSDFVGVSGRMEYLQKEPFSVIVDFAHTPNALEMVLSSLKQRLSDNGKLHVVFGCAGMRDRSKREPMGKIAYKYANNIYVCSEDPRTEHLIDIDRQILQGMDLDIDSDYLRENTDNVRTFISEQARVHVYLQESVASRRQAIVDAITNASKNDIVVICGKGHEKSMCFGTTEYHWSDQEEVKHLL